MAAPTILGSVALVLTGSNFTVDASAEIVVLGIHGDTVSSTTSVVVDSVTLGGVTCNKIYETTGASGYRSFVSWFWVERSLVGSGAKAVVYTTNVSTTGARAFCVNLDGTGVIAPFIRGVERQISSTSTNWSFTDSVILEADSLSFWISVATTTTGGAASTIDAGWTNHYDADQSTDNHRVISSKSSTVRQSVTPTLTLATSEVGVESIVSFYAGDWVAPAISSAESPVINGSTGNDIVTVNSGTTQGTVFIGDVEQTVTAWSNTAVTYTNVRGTNRYGGLSLAISKPPGMYSDPTIITFSPASGWDSVDLSGTLASSGDRITALPDLASGDQISWGNVQGTGDVSIGTNGVLIDIDGTFICDDWVTSFDVEAHDGTGWGTTATQTVGSIVVPVVDSSSSVRSYSVVSFSANGSLNIAGNTASSDIAVDDEEVVGAYIRKVIWHCPANSSIVVKRGTTLVGVYTGTGTIDYSALGVLLTANNDQTLAVTLVGTANAVVQMQLGKIL